MFISASFRWMPWPSPVAYTVRLPEISSRPPVCSSPSVLGAGPSWPARWTLAVSDAEITEMRQGDIMGEKGINGDAVRMMSRAVT